MIGALEPRQDVRRLALRILGQVLRPETPVVTTLPRKILVVRPDHLGDLLFLTPALRRLREAFPSAEIFGLVGPWGVPVLGRNPHLSGLITWDFPWFDRRPRRSSIGPYASLLQLAARLRRERFDLAIQFRPDFWWGALAVRLAGGIVQVGYDVPLVSPFLDRKIPVQHGLAAAADNLRLVAEIAGPGPAGRLEFPLEAAERQRAAELLKSVARDRCLVAIQVGAGARVKLWPFDRLVTVGRSLRDQCGATLVVVGGESEREAVSTVVQGIGERAIGLAGQTTVGELAAVLERCQLAVGPDSGPLHLAVAVGTPTLHLFGPADATRFGPYGDPDRHRVIRADWPCVPCDRLDFGGTDLERHDCMAHIAPDDVVDVARELLARFAKADRVGDPSAMPDG